MMQKRVVWRSRTTTPHRTANLLEKGSSKTGVAGRNRPGTVPKRPYGTGRGQSTIELLLILSVLLVILGLSVSIFSNHRAVSSEKHAEFLAHRNAKLLADSFIQASAGPIGGSFTLFLIPSPIDQTVYVRSGYVDVESGQIRVLVPLPNQTWSAGPFYDGNVITITRDWNSVHAYEGE